MVADNDKFELLAEKYAVVLDDIEKWQKVATDNLAYYGCDQIVYFENKNIIIEAYQSNNIQTPDIVLLDVNLNSQTIQNKEGLEVSRFFKKNFLNTTIILMSSLENITEEAERNGANFIIQKKNFIQDFDAFVQQYTQSP